MNKHPEICKNSTKKNTYPNPSVPTFIQSKNGPSRGRAKYSTNTHHAPKTTQKKYTREPKNSITK